MGDQTHIDDLKKALSDPLHRKLLEGFTEMIRDPERGVADYATGLKTILEEEVAVKSIDAAAEPHD